jgi:hypothetical protein
LWRFILDVPAPHLPPVLMLLILGSSVNLPLVAEFTSHISGSILMAMLFSTIVFPPAVEVSNVLQRASSRSASVKKYTRWFKGFVPHELGGPPKCCKEIDDQAVVIAKMFQSKAVLCFAFCAVVVIIIGGSLKESSPTFDGTVPELFHQGHRLRLKPLIFDMFDGEDLPGDEEAPELTMQELRACKPGASELAECSWYRCEVDNQVYPQPRSQGECQCYHQLSIDLNADRYALQQCSLAAKFFGLPDSGFMNFVKVHFWEWVEVVLDSYVTNSSISVWNHGPLELEDWLVHAGLVWHFAF